jgi:3-hydroxybutyryl-CoA dehydrogenase
MVGFGPADLGSNPSRATSHIRNFINRLRFDITMAIQNIAVLGAGQMGNGITQVAAAAGYNVMMIDIQQEYVDKGLATIERSLGKLVSKERMSQEDADATLARISLSTDRADCADCDLVVEAVPEIVDLKTSIFAELDSICKPETILASNTSSISISTIADATNRPDKVIGMHFMNPVPIMKLVEVINGNKTSSETNAAVIEASEKMGKIALSCNDSPGFVSNRILCPMLNEAILTLQEGVAEPEAIDGIMKLGMNHPIGPLALSDLIGLDTVLHIMNVLYEGLKQEKYAPAPLLVQMVEEGKLGRKTGEGFYTY